METKKKIKVEKEEEITDEIICDFCGKKYKADEDGRCNEPYGTFDIVFGYGSAHDMDRWWGHICDGCFEKTIKPKLKHHEEYM